MTAAAKAGMSERTARKYVRSGGTPSQAKPLLTQVSGITEVN